MRTRSLALVASLPLLPLAYTASPTPTNSLNTRSTSVELASLPDSSQDTFLFPPAPSVNRRFARRKRQAVSDGLSGIGGTGTDPGTGAGATAGTGATTTAAAGAGATTAAGGGAAPTTTQAQATTTQQQQTTQPATTTQQQQTQTVQTSQAATTTPAASPSTSAATSATQAPAASSQTSAPAASQLSSASTPTDAPSASSQSGAAASASRLTSVLVTYTSLFTNSDGSVSTSTGTVLTPSSVPIKNDSSGSTTGKTWAIVGGVIGGVVVVAALVFVVYRMTQRRFSSLDNDDLEEIKWPELQGDNATSTLKPLDTHRTIGAHGVGDDGETEYGGGGGVGRLSYMAVGASDPRRASNATLLSASHHGHGHAPYPSISDTYALPTTHSRQASYEQLAMIDGGAAAFARSYDPFVNPGGTQYPPSPPQYQSQWSAAPVVQHRAIPGAEPEGHLVSPAPRRASGGGGAMRVTSPVPSIGRSRSPAATFEGLPQVGRSESPFQVPGLSTVADEEKKGPL
ncbi:hypothetical protein Rt10032_c20g6392 [Rhodotorula toruloides]|uniref:Proteophosphoglycan ppg4 n=1 Tax=Rhodotorula toruloides TaxID=5286 RepID=A0A511KR37_RHOTO|nr:hypothetical protein Rt10032_c20g6392 [Rhodotorula toruloides]